MAEDTYTVERSASIDAPPASVYEQIVDFHRWMAWSPWEGMDPDQERTYSGADAGPGARYAWSGNRKVGQGRMEITGASEPDRVDIDLVFEKPWKAHNTTAFAITPEGGGSRVVWSMTGKKTFGTKVMSLFTSMDKMLGKDFEKGLAQLKATAEKSTG